MRVCRLSVLMVLSAAVLLGDIAQAQQMNQGGGSSSSFGNRNIGSSISAGQSGMFGGGSSNRSGGMGAGGSGGNVAGTGAGQVNSSDRFLRNNRRGAFVGADARDNTGTAILGSQRGNAAGNQANRNMLGNAGMMQNMGRNNNANNRRNAGLGGGMPLGGQSTRREIRTSYSVDFDYGKPTGGEVSSSLAKRLKGTQGLKTLSPLEIEIQADGSATLRGVVATQRDRALAERLALLEAGIWKVHNELEVSAPTGKASPAQGATPTSAPAAMGPDKPSLAPSEPTPPAEQPPLED